MENRSIIIKVTELFKRFFNVLFSKSRTLALIVISIIKRTTNVSETDLVFKLFSGKKGVMIDVGAHCGESLKPFAKKKWEVYAFEPNPINRKILQDNFSRYSNIKFEDFAVSDKKEKNKPFYISDISSGISGLSNFHESHKSNGTVDTITLTQYCSDENITLVDFLKIDTEGFDLFVLKGFPWSKISPKVIVCEFEDNKTLPLGYSYHEMAKFIQQKGYHLIISEWYPIIEYGLQHKWRCFETYPYDLQDKKNGWGNIIAVKDTAFLNKLSKMIKRYNNK